MNQDLPEPDFSFDCDGTPCYYATTVRSLIAAAVEREREECAQVCDGQIERWTDDRARYCASECAAAIRSRGEMK